MLNCLARFFFGDLSGKTTSGILRDNYFARERKPKLTRPVVRGGNRATSLRISTGNRNPAIRVVSARHPPIETLRECTSKQRSLVYVIDNRGERLQQIQRERTLSLSLPALRRISASRRKLISRPGKHCHCTVVLISPTLIFAKSRVIADKINPRELINRMMGTRALGRLTEFVPQCVNVSSPRSLLPVE